MIASLVARFARGEDTPAGVVEGVLDGYREEDRFFTHLASDHARELAATSTARWRSGNPAGGLEGLPIAVKDCIDVAGMPTTNGSVVDASPTAASRDADVVRALRARGAIPVGKTNLSELAFSGVGTNPHHGTPVNPRSTHTPLVTGGSSSGSAAAVASGQVPLALGTDTSGSVRVPAAFCGVVGYKASERRFRRDGVRTLSPTLDTLGLLAPTAADLAFVIAALDGGRVAPDAGSGGPVRLVVPEGDEVVADADPQVADWFDRAVRELTELDRVRIERRPLPVLSEAQALMDGFGTIVAAEAFARYGRLLEGPAAALLDPAVVRRLRGASAVRETVGPVRSRMGELRERVRVELAGALLLCPTVRHAPPPIAEVTASDEAFDRWNARILRTTVLLSYLGMPGVSVPRGTGRQLGLGLLVSAPVGHDHAAVRAAQLLDDVRELSEAPPREQIGSPAHVRSS
ncbi:aspartyl-tRNA(Asn)/glutamyl-tRNA(Gln) amidotransferase subunit A [Nocardioides thalensis]|uniref:Aspartyl-tRNA(Asn)/glutamyl-tRNA(Gln) amidotransferase subunit A n=1 Tax=Nocardioides thalensis TaxID=1914755 RepID=A0A853C9K9_9ACTN|nr:aspartyl-tRNA(Asn)/glutamyl-tRNA(Gln) amidotransferase subunit A [Nocardioides thalensis]